MHVAGFFRTDCHIPTSQSQMKKLLLSWILAVIPSLCTAQEGERYQVDIDLSRTYTEGEFIAWTAPVRKPAASPDAGAVSMSGAAAKPAAAKSDKNKKGRSVDDFLAGKNLIARASLKDGKARIEGDLDQCQLVNFIVFQGKNGGRRVSGMAGQRFLLEAGTTRLIGESGSAIRILDGKYGSVLYAWQTDQNFQQAKQESRQAYSESRVARKDGKSLEEVEALAAKGAERAAAAREIQVAVLQEIITGHSDLNLRRLATDLLPGLRQWKLGALRAMLKDHPSELWIQEGIAFQEMKLAARKAASPLGKKIQSFAAPDTTGKTVELDQVLADNKYVLVEFWASWCGPCRLEIPYLKQAYEKYHAKGFEIYAFSLDKKKDAWVEASKQEDLPWINVSDLIGSKSPVCQSWKVTVVPMNFLVEGKTGKVVGMNLRRLGLEQKLAELLEGQTSNKLTPLPQ